MPGLPVFWRVLIDNLVPPSPKAVAGFMSGVVTGVFIRGFFQSSSKKDFRVSS
jgi:hypothetical protein